MIVIENDFPPAAIFIICQDILYRFVFDFFMKTQKSNKVCCSFVDKTGIKKIGLTVIADDFPPFAVRGVRAVGGIFVAGTVRIVNAVG